MTQTIHELIDTSVFPFGGQYAPVAKATEVPMTDWEADLTRLRDLGMNAFRAFVPWDRIERVEGQRDYSMIDRAIELAEKLDLKVFVHIGGVFANLQGIYPPQWLWRDYDVQKPCETAPDATVPASSGSGPLQWICKDDPIYRDKTESFLCEVIERIGKSRSVHSWNVWNEPAARPCYCPHTVGRFRTWLQGRYENPADVAEAWSREFPVLLRSWDEITPPSGVGFLHGGYAPWLDWMAFCQQNMTDLIAHFSDLVHQHDPLDRPTTVNMAGAAMVYWGKGHYNVDGYAIGQAVDIIGSSAYTIFHRDRYHPALTAVNNRHIRAASTLADRSWLTLETEAGPVYWVHGSEPRHTTAAQRRVRYWQLVGNGSRCISAWMLRSRIANAQAGEFGMLAWDGSVTHRARVAGEVSARLNRHAELFQTRATRNRVAVLASHSSAMLYTAESYEARPDTFRDFWDLSIMGITRQLYDLHLQVDYLDKRSLSPDSLAPYDILFVPFHPDADEPLAEALRAYVEAGGTVVAEFGFGVKTPTGDLHTTAPGAGLAELFGCFANDALPLPAEEMPITLADSKTLQPKHFFQRLHAADTADVIGSWPDGSTAIVRNRVGEGTAVLAGTMLFYQQCRDEPAEDVLALLRGLLAQAGVKPDLTVVQIKPGCDERLIEHAHMVHDNPAEPPLELLLNHNPADAELRLRFPLEPGQTGPKNVVDILRDETHPATAGPDHWAVTLTIPASDAVALIDAETIEDTSP